VIGPHGSKYRRLYLGRADKKDNWKIKDLRTGKIMDGEPAPEHLIYAAETVEESMPMIAKLCIRPNDTAKGRQIKLNHYIDLYKRYFGVLPPDINLFVRNDKDIPITHKKEVKDLLEEVGWEPREIPQEPSLMGLDGD
jgi:acetyl-CoA decarbonylase/synthase complex subunit alpha